MKKETNKGAVEKEERTPFVHYVLITFWLALSFIGLITSLSYLPDALGFVLQPWSHDAQTQEVQDLRAEIQACAGDWTSTGITASSSTTSITPATLEELRSCLQSDLQPIDR